MSEDVLMSWPSLLMYALIGGFFSAAIRDLIRAWQRPKLDDLREMAMRNR